MSKGKYICLEGGDGSGKSTLAAALHERIGDENAISIRFPSDGIVGKVIRKGLMGELSLESKPFLYLFAADGLQEELWIEDHLNIQGQHIICDRHPTLSGRVYQLLHHGVDEIEDVYNAAARDGISMPDHLFVVEVPDSVALERMKSRKKYVDVVFERDDLEYIHTITERYRMIASRFGGTILDGTKTTEELVEEIMEVTGLA